METEYSGPVWEKFVLPRWDPEPGGMTERQRAAAARRMTELFQKLHKEEKRLSIELSRCIAWGQTILPSNTTAMAKYALQLSSIRNHLVALNARKTELLSVMETV